MIARIAWHVLQRTCPGTAATLRSYVTLPDDFDEQLAQTIAEHPVVTRIEETP